MLAPMRIEPPRATFLWLVTAIATLFACAPAAPRPAAPAVASAPPAASLPVEVAEEPVASLRTGELSPIEHPQSIEAKIIARFSDDRYETLGLEMVLPLSAAFDWSERVGCRVAIDQEGAAPYAFAAIPDDVAAVEGRGLGAATVWVRRTKDQEAKPVTGTVFTPQLGAEAGHKVRFASSGDAKAKSDPKVIARWASALAAHLHEIGAGPWNEFAAARVEEVFGDKKKRKVVVAQPRAPRDSDEMARTMETTTGMLSIQEALQHDRPLLLALTKEKRAVPIAKLSPPKSAPHPWDEMLRAISTPSPVEPLAAAVPADFWYLRATDISALLRLADELDGWGTPFASLMDRNIAELDLASRYQTQLGLTRSALGRALGREVIESVALVGSDPYLREGSDLTAVFAVKQAALFGAALEAMLAGHAQAHAGAPKKTVSHEGVGITVAASADGAVRQHRATVNGLEIVTNSLGAMKSVLDAIQGRRPRLADEKDFRYMLARDAGQGDPLLGFFGDRFVAEVTGPRQKVLESRRQAAAAELTTPGFAALLYGFIYGKSPSGVDELFASKLLHKEELKHSGGAPIDWRPGAAARSDWGTPAALTPLIDLDRPTTVSESERVAYERFSRTYETYWRQYIDPAALRVEFRGPNLDQLSLDLRVLPLIDGTDYRDILELAGQTRVKAPPVAEGVRAVVGIGPTAKLRRELSDLASGSLGRHGFKLDFLGDWAMVGIWDRTRIADVARKLRNEFPQAPEAEPTHRGDEIAEAARIPAYAAVAIRSASGAALALAAVRKMTDEAIGGMVSWTDAGTEGGTTIVRVALGKDREQQGEGARSDVSVFYALTEKVFFASLDEGVLRRLIGDVAEGRGPAPAHGSADGSQLVFDLNAKPGGGLFTAFAWLLSEQLVHASAPARAQAEAVLRGSPERARDGEAVRALSFAYFGTAPTPPYGGAYTLGADGLRDPLLGTASSPRWPRLPVPGSMVDRLLAAVGRFRSEIAFEREGGDAKASRAMQSLHLRITRTPAPR